MIPEKTGLWGFRTQLSDRCSCVRIIYFSIDMGNTMLSFIEISS